MASSSDVFQHRDHIVSVLTSLVDSEQQLEHVKESDLVMIVERLMRAGFIVEAKSLAQQMDEALKAHRAGGVARPQPVLSSTRASAIEAQAANYVRANVVLTPKTHVVVSRISQEGDGPTIIHYSLEGEDSSVTDQKLVWKP